MSLIERRTYYIQKKCENIFQLANEIERNKNHLCSVDKFNWMIDYSSFVYFLMWKPPSNRIESNKTKINKLRERESGRENIFPRCNDFMVEFGFICFIMLIYYYSVQTDIVERKYIKTFTLYRNVDNAYAYVSVCHVCQPSQEEEKIIKKLIVRFRFYANLL